jgi:hypothetical protein
VAPDPNSQPHDLADHNASVGATPDGRPVGRWLNRFLPAMLLAATATLAIGWLAFLISRAGVAPAVLFPIATGLAVGAAQTAILRKLELSLPWLAAAVLGLAWGGLAVATEDYSGYRDYLSRFAEVQRGDRLASIVQATTDEWQPPGFFGYLSAVVRRDPVWWSVDAALTPLAAAVVAGTTSRRHKSAAAPPSDSPPSPPSRGAE